MSCKGIGAQFGEIADKIDQLQDRIDQVVDTTVDAIASELGIRGLQAKFLAMQGEFEALFQKEFGNLENFLDQLKDGIPFSEDIQNLMALGAQTVEFVNKLEDLKDKYGNDSAVEDILRDPAGFLDTLGADLEKLCEALPNFEKGKDGKIKVTAAKFNLDAGEIDAEELLNEGVSPLIKRIKEALRRMTRTFEEDKVSSLNKATDTNFG